MEITTSVELEIARGEHNGVKRSRAKRPLTSRQNTQEIIRVSRRIRNTEGRSEKLEKKGKRMVSQKPKRRVSTSKARWKRESVRELSSFCWI